MQPVTEDTLNRIIAHPNHNGPMPEELIYTMAVELSKSRYVIDCQYKFIGELLSVHKVEEQLDVCEQVTG